MVHNFLIVIFIVGSFPLFILSSTTPILILRAFHGPYFNCKFTPRFTATPPLVPDSSFPNYPCTKCTGITFAGGYGVITGYRQFRFDVLNMVPYTHFMSNQETVAIDSWLGTQNFVIELGTSRKASQVNQVLEASCFSSNKCGSTSFNDCLYPVRPWVTKVFSNTGTYKFYVGNENGVTVMPDLMIWGINYVALFIRNECTDPGCLRCSSSTPSICTECIFLRKLTSDFNCKCVDGFYHMNKIWRPQGNAYYNCLPCHYTCKKCLTEGIDQCIECYSPYTLESNKCVLAKGIISLPFFVEEIKEGDYYKELESWEKANTLEHTLLDSNCFWPTIMVGGQNNFGRGAYLQKTFTLLPHYYVKIHLYFYKIFNWENGEMIKIFANDKLIYQNKIVDGRLEKSIYEGKMCGSETSNDAVDIVDAEFIDSSLQLKFRMESTLDEDATDESWGMSHLNIVSQQCHPLCYKCTGSEKNQCTECYKNFILSNGECKCLLILKNYENPCKVMNCATCIPCPDGQYAEPSTNECMPCDKNCMWCDYFSKNCTKCFEPLVLHFGKCISVCPDGYYKSYEDNSCKKCNTLCTKCSGPSVNECSECRTGFRVVNGKCVYDCGDNLFYNEETKKCQDCQIKCKICFNEYSCEECTENNYFQIDSAGKKYCLPCPEGNFVLNKFCYKCGENCLKCTDEKNCTLCQKNYYIDKSSLNSDNYICFPRIILDGNANLIQNTTNIVLKFNDTWNNFFEKIEYNNLSYYNITIKDLENVDYEFKWTKSQLNEFILSIQFYYNILEIKEVKISFKLNELDSPTTMVRLITLDYNVMINSFKVCQNNFYYDRYLKNCVNSPAIEVKLFYTSTRNIIKLKFLYGDFPFIQEKINNYSNITIDRLNISDYSYKILPNNNSEYNIIYIPLKNILNGPFLHYRIAIPDKYILQYNLNIISTYDRIQLFDSYAMSEAEKEAVEKLTSISNVGDTLLQVMGIGSAFSNPSNSFVLRLLVLIELIYLLKFIDINYPPNLIDFFLHKSGSNYNFLFPYKFKEMEEDKAKIHKLFEFYEVSPYFLNNSGNRIIEIILLLILAYVFGILYDFVEKVSAKKNQRIFKVLYIVMTFFRNAFKFTVFIYMFLSSLQFLNFMIACSFYVYPVGTTNGMINFIVSVICFFLMILFTLHLIFVINRIYYLLNHRSNYQNSDNINNIAKVTPLSGPGFISIESLNKKDIDDIIPPTSPLTALPSVKKQVYETWKNYDAFAFDSGNLHKVSADSPELFVKTNQFGKINESSIDKIAENNLNQSKPEEKACKKLKAKIIILCFNFYNFFKYFWKRIYSVKNEDEYLRKYSILHKDFKIGSFFSRFFLLLSFIRQSTMSMIVGYCFHNPFYIILTLNCIQLGFIILMIVFDPFKVKLYYFANIFFEIIVFVAYLAALLIAVLDLQFEIDTTLRINLGWVIIIMNIILFLSMILFVIIVLFYENINCDRFKRKKKTNKIAPIESENKNVIT